MVIFDKGPGMNKEELTGWAEVRLAPRRTPPPHTAAAHRRTPPHLLYATAPGCTPPRR